MLLMLHPPFVLADGGVLQTAPAPEPAPALYLTAVCNRAGALLLLSPLGCEATDAMLSSPSNPTLPWSGNLHSREQISFACCWTTLRKVQANFNHLPTLLSRCTTCHKTCPVLALALPMALHCVQVYFMQLIQLSSCIGVRASTPIQCSACTLGRQDRHAHLRPGPVPADALLTPFGNPGGWVTGGGGGKACCVTPEPACDDGTAASPPLLSSLRRYRQYAPPSATVAMGELEDPAVMLKGTP